MCQERPCERVGGWVCVCEKGRETRDGNRASGYSANTANPVTLLQARTSPFTERCWKGCVSEAPYFSSSLSPPSPFLCGLLRYWKHHGGQGEQQVVSLVDFCLQAQAELKRNAVKRKAIRKEGIKERARLLGYSYYTHPRKAPKPLSSGGKTVTTDMPQSSKKCLPDKNRTQRDTEMLHAPYSQGHPQKKLLAVPYWI